MDTIGFYLSQLSMSAPLQAFRGSFLHCVADPAEAGDASAQYFADGVLLVENGLVVSLEEAGQTSIPADCAVQDFTGKLLVPGFVDTHIHYPQVDVIASHGTQLLDWLETYTFPTEQKFDQEDTASSTAHFFLDELMRNGTTTALVFATVYKQSVDAFFTAAKERNLRMLCGKVMMDRNAPSALCDTPESSYTESQELIAQWHNQDRLGYAVTPRFAPTSSDEQLRMAGKLLSEHPDVHLHTHLSENIDECNWVASLFPNQQDYLSVYEHFGLVRKRSVFAHGIHLSHSEWSRLGKAQASVAHCPTSNLFIGSGLFDLPTARKAGVKVGLGTDIGGGDSFSLLRTINEAYKIQQLQGVTLDPLHAFYMATLGGAVALDLDDRIGNFAPGKEADFVALDTASTPLLKRRTSVAKDWQSMLFALMMLGDDRCVYDTFILGESAKRSLG